MSDSPQEALLSVKKRFEEAYQELRWMLSSLEDHPYVLKHAGESFANQTEQSRDSCRMGVVDKMLYQIKLGLQDCDEEQLISFLNEKKWGEDVVPRIEKLLLSKTYEYCFRERFPKLYNLFIEGGLQAELVEGKNGPELTKTILGLYGHSYFFNREPTIVRVVAPFQQGAAKKGKRPEVPQEDLALFLYNSNEVRSESTTEAVVSLDGVSLTTIPASHTRVKLIKRESLVDKALAEGIYSTKGMVLPVKGLFPFWQREFIAFLKRSRRPFKDALFSLIDDSSITGVYDQILLSAKRFIGDRLTPKQYWEDLNTIRLFRLLFQGSVFIEAVRKYQNSLAQLAFRLMTITTS